MSSPNWATRSISKQLLIPCAYYLDAAYKMRGLLARLYPEEASAVAVVMRK
jgi:hypothetical protein